MPFSICDLNESDQKIAASEVRLTKQRLMVEELRAGEHDTVKAEAMLREFEQTLRDLVSLREVIARELQLSAAGHVSAK